MEKTAKHPVIEPIDESENITIPTGTIPIKTLKLMIENGTERERVIRSKTTSDGSDPGIELVEKRSLVLFEMSNKDAMNIIIEHLEQDLLYNNTIPGDQTEQLEE